MERREDQALSTRDLAAQRGQFAADPPASGPTDTVEPAAAPQPEAQVTERPAGSGQENGPERFIEPDRLEEFRSRWTDVQARFVDDPKGTVEEADHLVAELFQVLAQTFAEGRSRLEEQWSRGELNTEDLRQLVHRYRALFDTLLRS